MPSTILIIQGHPDPAGGHLCRALADAYAEGAAGAGESFPKKLMKGKSARLVVTMGVPVLLYRWFYLSHGLRALGEAPGAYVLPK